MNAEDFLRGQDYLDFDELSKEQISFRTFADIHNSIFGTSYKASDVRKIGSFTDLSKAYHPAYGTVVDDGAEKQVNMSIGFIGTDPRREQGWQNILEVDGKTLHEIGEERKTGEFSEIQPDLRAWFVSEQQNTGPYRFIGVFRAVGAKQRYRTWQRISKRLRILREGTDFDPAAGAIIIPE